MATEPLHLIGRSLKFTHGVMYDDTPITVLNYTPMLAMKDSEDIYWLPAIACRIHADGTVTPSRP